MSITTEIQPKRRVCLSVDEDVARILEVDARKQRRSMSNYVAWLVLSNRALSETDSRLTVVGSAAGGAE